MRENRRRSTVRQMVQYVRRYGSVLETGDASPLLSLSTKNRQHAMCSLAALSKFYGCYDRWQAIKNRHQLKWSNSEEDCLRFFQNFLNGRQNYSAMLTWIKNAMAELPAHYANILLFNTVTGLRPSEAVESIKLLRSDKNYLNEEQMVLEHFRHPQIFLRKTKKAYVTHVTPEILDIAAKCEPDDSWNGLYGLLKRKRLGSHTKYCRAVFATHLRKQGIEPELIDIFQGRVPRTVFARHYFRPDFMHEQDKIRAAVVELHKELEPSC
jgi:intergrase/recombinase